METKIILASKSPRRSELLSLMGINFEVIPSDAEEDNNQKIKLTKLSESLSRLKAKDVFDKKDACVLPFCDDRTIY